MILVVDDHVEGIEPQLRFLEKVGYKLQIVVSASEAMGFIEVVRPGLVMLDLMTPWLAGLQFLRVLKGRRQLAGIPVIVYTTETDPNVRESALGLGASDFLIKADVNLTQILERTNACYQETIPPETGEKIAADRQANRVVGRIYQPWSPTQRERMKRVLADSRLRILRSAALLGRAQKYHPAK